MQMQPQPQQPNNNAAATQAAMAVGKAQAKPAKPNDKSKFGEGDQGNIMATLEQHLNTLDPKQKTFLAGALQHYAPIVIPVLGIVCGQEVFQYFMNIYNQHFANKQQSPQQVQHPAVGQQNSAPAQQAGPNPGQPMPQAQPQQAGTPGQPAP